MQSYSWVLYACLLITSLCSFANEPTDLKIQEKTEQLLQKLNSTLSWPDFLFLIKETRCFVKTLDTPSQDQPLIITNMLTDIIDKTDASFIPDRFSDSIQKNLIKPMLTLYEWIDEGTFILNDPSYLRSMTLKQFTDHLKSILTDGLQMHDIFIFLKLSYNFVTGFPLLSIPEQKRTILDIMDAVIDWTDTPYLPDFIFDPIFKAILPTIVDEIYSLLNVKNLIPSQKAS